MNRFAYVAAIITLVVVAAAGIRGQQISAALPVGDSPALPSQAATAGLQQSLTAQTGGSAIADITLSGTVTYIHGTQTESGPMKLTALSAGTTKVEFDLPSGTRTETWSNAGHGAVISGSGPNGSVTKPAGSSVAMPSPSWFVPGVLTSLLSGPAYSLADTGNETRNGATVRHIAVTPASASGSPAMPASIPRYAQTDVYLDPATSLPASVSVFVWPSNPPGVTTPLSIRARPTQEEVRFSDYRVVRGQKIPFHIQLFLGTSPRQQQIMDLTVSTVAIDSGATIAIPTPANAAN